MTPPLFEAESFFQPKNNIHILNRLAGCALYQVVDSGEDQDLALDAGCINVAVIRAGNVFHAGWASTDLHKRLLNIKALVELSKLLAIGLSLRLAVYRRENPPIKWTSVRLKQNLDLAASNLAGDLLHLRHVTVRPNSVGEEILIHVGKMKFAGRIFARSRCAGHRVDNDAVGLNKALFKQWCYGQGLLVGEILLCV